MFWSEVGACGVVAEELGLGMIKRFLYQRPELAALVFVLPWVGLVGALLWWNPVGDFWGGVEFPKAQCEAYSRAQLSTGGKLSEAVYDETALRRLIREPQNTISNLAYLWLGVAVIFAGWGVAGRMLGGAAVVLALGSGIYHASLLPEWRLIDIVGVYLVLFMLVYLAVSVWWTQLRNGWSGWIGSGLVWVGATLAAIYRNDVRLGGFKFFDSTYVVGALVGMGSVLCVAAVMRISREKRRAAWLWIGIMAACMGVAFSA